MKLSISNVREEQLARKLALLLGSQKNWLSIYADWCAENSVGSDGAQYDDHNIQVFVRTQRQGRAA